MGQALLHDQQDAVQSYIQRFQDLFPERFYLELQRTGKANEEAYIVQVVELSNQTGLPLVATNDVRFSTAFRF